jgi:hypothetical protein
VLADRLGDMGEIELDGPAAARLEVNEHWSVRGADCACSCPTGATRANTSHGSSRSASLFEF